MIDELPIGRALVPLVLVVCCALLAGLAPIGVSIIAVFLFAGPHNWFEIRYFLTRMPARWGRLTTYFSIGLSGTLVLGGLFAAMPWLAGNYSARAIDLVAGWNSLLVVWIIGMALLRSQLNPRRDWNFLIPLGFSLLALNWLWPLAWSLALVYVHPLMALVFLGRELKRTHSPWLKSYRAALVIVPACLVGLCLWLADGPNLPDTDVLSWQITHHAGAGVISQVSTHFLVAVHVFLELLHYAIWIIVIPSIVPCLKLDNMPLARRSIQWRRLVVTIVIVGIGLILLLWGGFLADYPWTRNLYFTVAILHVLGEVPFLLRLL